MVIQATASREPGSTAIVSPGLMWHDPSLPARQVVERSRSRLFGSASRRATIWIGVVGHRPNRLVGADDNLLHQRVRQVFQYAAQVSPAIAVVSPLAEGADRVVAHEALAAGCPLYGLLPFSSDEYAQDFECPSSLAEYHQLLDSAAGVYEMPGSHDTAADAEAAYAAAADALLMVDVLIAIWDGLPARGLGGTANTVLAASERGIPVAWVNPQPPHHVCVLVQEQSGLIELPLGDLPMRVARRREHHERHRLEGTAWRLTAPTAGR